MYCAYCGKEIGTAENTRFCIYCGKMLWQIEHGEKAAAKETDSQTERIQYAPKAALQKQKNHWKIPVIVAAIAASIGLSAFFLLQNGVNLNPFNFNINKTNDLSVSSETAENRQADAASEVSQTAEPVSDTNASSTAAISQTEEPASDTDTNSDTIPAVSENLLHPYLTENTYQKNNLYTVIYDRIYLNEAESAKYPQLSASLSTLFDTISADAAASIANFEGLSDEEASLWQNTFSTHQADVIRADSAVFCIEESESVYEAGMPHQQYGSYGYNYDTQTGRQLSLSDVVTDMSSFSDLVVNKIKEKYPDLTFLSGEETVKEELRNGECAKWNLGYEELILYFNRYSLSSWNAGSQLIVLPFAEYPDLFNSTYTQPTDSWIIPFTSLYLDSDGDEKPEELSVISHWAYIEDYSFESSFDISLGDNTFSFDNNYDTTSSKWYVRKINGAYFLYRLGTLSSEEDETVLEIFALNNGKVEKLKAETAADMYQKAAASDLIQLNNEETQETKILLTDPLYLGLPSETDNSAEAVYQAKQSVQNEAGTNESSADETINSITANGYFDFSYDSDGVYNENEEIIAYIEPDAEFTECLTDTDGEEYYEIPAAVLYYPDGSSGIEVQTNIRFTDIASILVKANDKYFTEYSYDIEDFIIRYNGDWPFHDEFKNFLEKGKRNSIITFNIVSYDYSTGYIEDATINIPY